MASAFASMIAAGGAGTPLAQALPKTLAAQKDKARAVAQDFEAVFLSTMFAQMFTETDGEGPFGGAGSTGIWRSFLTDEYAKSVAKAGGIGLADHIYNTLLAQQELRTSPSAEVKS